MNIKSFGIMMVTFLILSSTIINIVPKGKMENSVKFVISICFIFLLLSSAKLVELEIPKIEIKETNSTYNTIYSLTLDTTKDLLENKIQEILETNGVYLEKIKINADISNDNSINISSVTYKTYNDDNVNLIEKIIFENTGCKNIEREKDEEFIIQ